MKTMLSPFKGGSRGTILWVVIHTAEGARTVDSLGKWFQAAGTNASSHVGIDDNETAQYVSYAEQAWTARSANPYADQAELCAFSKWTRPEWLSHPNMLEQTAQWIAERCRARGIPPVKLTSADVAARRPGVIGHINVTEGLRDGSHTDPGPNFPWDVVMARVVTLVRGGSANAGGSLGSVTPTPTPLTPAQIEENELMSARDDILAAIAGLDSKLAALRGDLTAVQGDVQVVSARALQARPGYLIQDNVDGSPTKGTIWSVSPGGVKALTDASEMYPQQAAGFASELHYVSDAADLAALKRLNGIPA